MISKIRRGAWLLGAFGVALLVVTGCAGDRYDPGRLLPVAGKVIVTGKPLHSGEVNFYADVSQGNKTPHRPTGTIDFDGRYELKTAGKKGAPPGWYRVVVASSEVVETKATRRTKMPKLLVDTKFFDENTTELLVEVVENPQPGAYDLDLSK